MSTIFDALPGLETPVGAISKNLARMWAADEKTALKPGEDSKATQVNFVLHLGVHTTPEDALERFQIAVKFSRRYPCRVVVLCPIRDDTVAAGELRAKIYGECHPGKTRGDLRCCEFVILSYPPEARRFLENQVSICLSTDLPLYYWAHNFSSSAKLGAYQYLLGKAKRVLIDRSLVSEDDCGELAWPRPEAVRDLVHARLLPVRQTIGQFLSAYAPALLATGLTGVTVRHGRARRAEARVLAGWLTERLVACGASSALVAVVEPAASAAGEDTVEVVLGYESAHAFRFQGDFAQGCAHFSANYRGARAELATAIGLLSPEAALSEAMFF
jgi:glucose-6-phosphate dehydrogenase assembly protein OpcA